MTDFDREARAAFARAGIHIGGVSWTNLHQKSQPAMHEGVEYDEDYRHGQDSIGWASVEPALFEEVSWRPNVTIVMEN